MDPNVGRIPNEPTTPTPAVQPVRRRREDGRSFDEELERSDGAPERAEEPTESPETHDRPVAPPRPGEVGGKLDLTA